MSKEEGASGKRSIVPTGVIAKEIAGVFLDKESFVLRDPDNAEFNKMADGVLSICNTYMQVGEYIKFLEASEKFNSFLDEEVFHSSFGERHTFKEISNIILDVVQGKPFENERDILLLWNNLDKFSPEVADSLKLSLKNDLQNIIQKQPSFDEGYQADIFVKGMLQGLENNQKSYPMVLLNKDDSVSVYIDTDWEKENPAPTEDNYDKTKHESYLYAYYAHKDEKQLRRQFTDLFSNPAFLMSLEHAVERHGFQTINGAPLIEVIPDEGIDVDQFKINLSPENLDSILKEQWQYVGYRNDGSLLDLYPHYELKPGKMMLAPVAAIEDQYALRITGCQVTEVPSIQLLDMLPDRPGGKIGRYHWEVQEVVESLAMGRGMIGAVLNEILVGSNALDNRADLTGGEGATIIAPPNKGKSSLNIVPMGETSKRFYAQFGQCTMEELEGYQSLEVDILEFLQASVEVLGNYITEMQEREKKYPSDEKAIENATRGKEMLAVLIAREKERASSVEENKIIGKWTSTVSRSDSSQSVSPKV